MIEFINKYKAPNTKPRHTLSAEDVVDIVNHELQACSEMAQDLDVLLDARIQDIERILHSFKGAHYSSYRLIDIDGSCAELDKIYRDLGVIMSLMKGDISKVEEDMSFRMEIMRRQAGDETICNGAPRPSADQIRENHEKFLAECSELTKEE